MRRRIRFGLRSLSFLLAGLLTASFYAAGAQGIDAISSSDGTIRLERILLLLQPPDAQGKSLDAFLAAQQTPGNAAYHHWLTPAQFADRFAVSALDAAMVTAWLRAHGFSVATLPDGRGWIEFSGTLDQVESAFGAQVNAISTAAGETRYQFAGPAKFPAGISSRVEGLVSLDGVVSAAAVTVPAELGGTAEALASEASLKETQSLTPLIAESQIHLGALQADGFTGVGESIAIPSRSNVREEDFTAFRRSFGLPESMLAVETIGEDPGRTSDEAAAILMASWAGVAAPEARIVLVPAASTDVTDGIDLALAATVDGALAHTVSIGYSACEAGISPAHQAFYAALYRQAAAEGIAIVAATGDSGAAACHSPSDTTPVQTGWGVNALASTPWNTAVGTVAFTADGSGLTAWQPSSDAGSAAMAAYASGGGASRVYSTPTWQSAAGMHSSDSVSGSALAHPRYLPDVSLPTAAAEGNSRGLAFCFSGAALTSAGGCRLVTAGGSAASAAVFSGVAALLAQRYGPQGNLAPNLYLLSRSNGSTGKEKDTQNFTDISSGGAMLRCVAGTTGCAEQTDGTTRIGFSATPGYDLATGLGSVNAQAIVTNWATPEATGTASATVEMTNVGGITYNPSKDITLSAKVISGSGGTVPTGTVQFFDESNSQNAGTPVTLGTDGTASYTEDGQFSIGGHNIAAIYSGDSTYAPGESQPITINIQPSPTTLIVTPSTTTPTGGSTITVTGTVTSSNPGDQPPTGSLTVTLDGLPQGTQRFTTTGTLTTASVNVTAPTAGSHTIQGTYSGDINYNNSTASSVTVTVSKSATVTSIVATPSTLSAGMPESLTATVAPATAATGATYTITGTISFYDGTTLLGTATLSSNSAVLPGIALSATVIHTLTAVYSGDVNYSASSSGPLILEPVLLPVTMTLTASSSVLAPGQSTTLTAIVTPVTTPLITAEQHPTGSVIFYAGMTPIGEGTLTAGLGDTGVATVIVPKLPAGAYVLTAQYAGDTTYGPAVSNSLNLAIEDFNVTCAAPDGSTNLNVQQGSSGSFNCLVVSLGGLTGAIQVVCAEQNPPQLGAMGCALVPTILNGTGQATMTVTTTAGNLSRNDGNSGTQFEARGRPSPRRGPPLWPATGGGAALAFAGLLLSPIGRRARWLKSKGGRMLALVLLLGGIAGAGIGCSNNVTLASNSGTPLGVHTIKITAAADVNTVTVSHYAYVTVNVTPQGISDQGRTHTLGGLSPLILLSL